jgi:hypothetical protein
MNLGDAILIAIVGFALLMSVRFRKNSDVMLKRLKDERIRLATDIARTRAEVAGYKNRLQVATMRRDNAAKEIEKRAKEAEDAEREVRRAEQTPPLRMYVLDRAQIRADKLWVVTFQREREGESDFTRIYRWTAERHVVVSANNPNEAEDRVRMRFPAAVGYRVLPPRPLQEVLHASRVALTQGPDGPEKEAAE